MDNPYLSRNVNMIYECAIYCRLSKEDENAETESSSIATQKALLTDYVRSHGWHLRATYIDDGYSGTNFERPRFQDMIRDIEDGKINCVITKDLSRLGRNYLDCGLYLEVFFPEHGVRYISVNDGVDTLNRAAMDITPFRNILNEMYAADISMKIKSAKHARFNQGKFMGTNAPYGYRKDPSDRNHLLIDEQAAPVVRMIFERALQGEGIHRIRNYLNSQHILRPAAYAALRGDTEYEHYFVNDEENRYNWSENSVRQILRNPTYAGDLVGYKRIAINMKSKKRPSKLPEEWEVVRDTHEGIITRDVFDTVQRMITSRRREKNQGGFVNLFNGIIKCADCGYAMRAMSANRRKRPDPIDCVVYNCNNYGTRGKEACTAHSLEARDLHNAVLADIRHFAELALQDDRAEKKLVKMLSAADTSKAKALEKERRKVSKRLSELDKLFSTLYEDRVMERITERNYEMMSEKYETEQLGLEQMIKELDARLNEAKGTEQGIQDFIRTIREYEGIQELTPAIVNSLIDRITVEERHKDQDGNTVQGIKIYYKFVGALDELHIEPTRRYAAPFPARCCDMCGAEFVPGSARGKYCKPCSRCRLQGIRL